MIFLQPHSGLANRIRVIVSGLKFAEVVNQQLTLFWTKDNALFCDFDDLFEPNDNIIIKKENWRNVLLKRFQQKKLLHKVCCKIFSIDCCVYDKDMRELVWSTGSNYINLAKLPASANNYFFFTCHEFYFEKKYLKYLKPVASVRKEVELNTANFNYKTIGLHIRRGDHIESSKESPIECFIELIESELKKDKEVNFYLATDNDDSKQTLN